MKQYAVVFTHNNARVIYAQDLKTLQGYENVVINPDLSYVAGIPPHFWKFVNGFIMPMDESEKESRMANIIKSGTANDVHARKLAELEEKRQAQDRAELLAQKAHEEKLQKEYEDNMKEYTDFQSSVANRFIEMNDEVQSTKHDLLSEYDVLSRKVSKSYDDTASKIERLTYWIYAVYGLNLVLYLILFFRKHS